MPTPEEVILMSIIVILVVFFVLRELFCWYWKINEAISLLKDIRNSLESSGIKHPITSSPTEYEVVSESEEQNK